MQDLKETVAKEARHENIVTYDSPAYKPRKRRFGDRKDGRMIRSLPAFNKFIPYIM